MKVIISGASGLVGRWLVPDLVADGHTVVRLVRSQRQAEADDAVLWRPDRGELDPSALAGADAVVNLNGRSIADGRWTRSVRDELRSSRLDSTRTLVGAIAAADPAPGVLVNASAIGFYGDRGEEELDESSAPGDGFLPELSQAWEEAALEARSDRTRVVALRLGMVLGRGGALAKMVPVFRLGGGGPLGSGRQWWSWVAMEDVLGMVRFAIEDDRVEGPVNAVAPTPVRCRDFVSTLGTVLHRPSFLPAPGFALRLVLGEMADALLLASTRVRPRALERLGYEFRAPDLADALRRALD
jgi:uncharacterized protein (TIGR01777 family)